MKTITKNNSSCYLYDDSEVITIGEEVTVVGNPETLIIADINLSNGKVFENVTPKDWLEINILLMEPHGI
jgi:hypothetical protein